MGLDKAFVDVDGRAMAARVADALAAGGCDEVVCQGGDVARLAAAGLDAVPDRAVGAGPAAAIVQAVEDTDWTEVGAVVIAACDLARLTGDAVAALLDAAVSDPGRVAVATAGGRHHLLIAVGRDSAAAVTAAPSDGRAAHPSQRHPTDRSVRALLARFDVASVPVAPDAVYNVNRPEDLHRSIAPPGD